MGHLIYKNGRVFRLIFLTSPQQTGAPTIKDMYLNRILRHFPRYVKEVTVPRVLPSRTHDTGGMCSAALDDTP